jgi:hypothetical protein
MPVTGRLATAASASSSRESLLLALASLLLSRSQIWAVLVPATLISVRLVVVWEISMLTRLSTELSPPDGNRYSPH